jgi:bifunctional DNA-binding transcriptional regulator/antitoxin component of YhaV-PrlF toxin-antitoxin module
MEKIKRWTLEVDEDGIVTLPEDLLETTGWQVGDRLRYTQEGDNWILSKIDNEVTEEEELAWKELEKKQHGHNAGPRNSSNDTE